MDAFASGHPERRLGRHVAAALLSLCFASPAVAHLSSDAEALAFLTRAEQEIAQADEANQRARWVNQTYLTEDTTWLSARANESFTALQMRLSREAAAFKGPKLAPTTLRRLSLLTLAIRSPSPPDAGEGREWADVQAGLVSDYNRHYVADGERRLGSYGEVRRAMETTDDPAALQQLWVKWHAVGQGLEPAYQRFVELSRVGAKSLGFADVGEIWRAAYDMPPDAMAGDVERLWADIKPLYVQLHCYTRAKLAAAYGTGVQPSDGPIRIELTRNPMGMYWVGAYDRIATDFPAPSYDLDTILESRRPTGRAMAEYADRFWTSMGLPAMPASFWAQSMFDKPRDREVVCPGSVSIVHGPDDVRLKMCAGANAVDFTTVHHEVGHAVYALAYRDQPYLFRASANDAFHEAVADLGALSITPSYLQRIGLIDSSQAPGSDQDLGLLMRMALQRVTFMPFSVIVDKWRWKVFSGQIPPERYDGAWWDLVARYQGLSPMETRREGSFDIASLPHVTSNVSYIRYFYAYLLEFQLFKAACDSAGWKGPLHRCTLYGDQLAGSHLKTMLAMGASRPWQDALAVGAGTAQVSADGMLAYFRPLREFLERENAGRQCGW